jgi:hypothetical protein
MSPPTCPGAPYQLAAAQWCGGSSPHWTSWLFLRIAAFSRASTTSRSRSRRRLLTRHCLVLTATECLTGFHHHDPNKKAPLGLANVSLSSATPHPQLLPTALRRPGDDLPNRPFDLIFISIIRPDAALSLYPPSTIPSASCRPAPVASLSRCSIYSVLRRTFRRWLLGPLVKPHSTPASFSTSRLACRYLAPASRNCVSVKVTTPVV